MTTLDWWPEPDTAEEWHWANETMKTIRTVARRGRIDHYSRDGYQEAAADLESWLIQEALVFREKYIPPNPDDTASQALDRWCRVLYTVLRQHTDWHFGQLYYSGSFNGQQLRWAVLTTDRIERPLGEDQGTVADIAGPVFPVSEQFLDPLIQHIRREVLEELLLAQFGIVIRNATLDVLLRELEKVAGKQPRRPGQCGEFGCMNPADGYRGLCQHHHKRWLKEDIPRCSHEDCTKAVVRAGCCTDHQPPCVVDGCTRTDDIVRDMCPQHYQQWRAEQTPPCSADDCERPVQARGLCRRHYKQWRADNADPCTVDGCHKPQQSRGLCSKHYQRSMKTAARKAS